MGVLATIAVLGLQALIIVNRQVYPLNHRTMNKKMTMTHHSINHCRGQGFSLIEALIALLVLSIGLLGVAGMQFKAQQGAHMAYQRSLANVIAIDAQERLWSQLQPGQACPPVSDVSDDWKKAWFTDGGDGRETLPGGGDSAVEIGEDGPCSYRVTVDWQEARKEGKEDISSLTYQFSLPGSTS